MRTNSLHARVLLRVAFFSLFFSPILASAQNYTLQATNFTNTTQDNNNPPYAGIYNASGSSIGLYANGGSGGFGSNPQDVAYHYFTSDGSNNSGSALALQVGQSVSVTFNLSGSQGINGNSIGFSLNSGSNFGSVSNYNTGGRFEVSFTGGDSTAKIYDSGTTALTNDNFTAFSAGVTYTLTLISTNEYNFTDSAGDSLNISTLGGTAGNAINSFALFNRGYNNSNSVFTSITVTNNSSIGYSVTSGSKNITGVINNNNGTANNIQKTGAGELVLQNANTFTGTTTIAANGGTLNASAANSLGGTSGITINSGGTLLLSGSTSVTDRIRDAATVTLNGGSFNTGGLNEGSHSTSGVGALTLQANSVINLGTGSSILHFADSSGATWTSSIKLSITNWSGNTSGSGTDQVLFGTSTAGLSSSQIAEIQFVNPDGFAAGTYGAMILSSGEIVPVPEPATWAAAVLALGAIAWTQRRRLTPAVAINRSPRSRS